MALDVAEAIVAMAAARERESLAHNVFRITVRSLLL